MVSNLKYSNALAVMTSSFRCCDDCPYCRSKSDNHFSVIYNRETFHGLADDLKLLYNEGYHFQKFILSGNGEPTLYTYRDLFTIVEALKKYSEMFDEVRLYTNGFVFSDDKLFQLMNSVFTQYVLTVVSLDLVLNNRIKKHEFPLWETDNISKAQKIKLDIAQTTYLSIETFCDDLDSMLATFPNIDRVLLMRLKNNIMGDGISKQNDWMSKHNMSDEEKIQLYRTIEKEYQKVDEHTFLTNGGATLLFGTGEKKIAPWLYWDCQKGFSDFKGEPLDRKMLVRK